MASHAFHGRHSHQGGAPKTGDGSRTTSKRMPIGCSPPTGLVPTGGWHQRQRLLYRVAVQRQYWWGIDFDMLDRSSHRSAAVASLPRLQLPPPVSRARGINPAPVVHHHTREEASFRAGLSIDGLPAVGGLSIVMEQHPTNFQLRGSSASPYLPAILRGGRISVGFSPNFNIPMTSRQVSL